MSQAWSWSSSHQYNHLYIEQSRENFSRLPSANDWSGWDQERQLAVVLMKLLDKASVALSSGTSVIESLCRANEGPG